jgi:hypothetical protein
MCGLLIAMVMEAARTSEMLVNFYQTTHATTQNTDIFIAAAIRTCSLR